MNILMKQLFLIVLSLVVMVLPARAQTVVLPTEMAALAINTALQNETFSVLSEKQRVNLVKNFARSFKKLDADELDAALLSGDVQAQASAWSAFEGEVVDVLALYQHARPVLLANVQLQLRDQAAELNKGELNFLFFLIKRHQQKEQPFSGLLSFQSEDGEALGLAATKPEWLGQTFVQQALLMEEELRLLREKHNAYFAATPESVQKKHEEAAKKFSQQIKANQKKVASRSVADVFALQINEVQPRLLEEIRDTNSAALSANARMKSVSEFAKFGRKLTDFDLGSADALLMGSDGQVQKQQAFMALLEEFRARYLLVKPILFQNIKLQRDDAAAKVNRGDLQSLFYRHHRNHYTGKPVSGLLRFQDKESVGWFDEKMIDAGVLVQFPGLVQEKSIQAAILVESELAALLVMHQDYLED